MGGARFFRPATPRFLHGGIFQFWSISRVETSGGIQASLAGRYATALFGLARDERQIDAVGRSLDSLIQALADSRELSRLVESPLVSRKDAGKALGAIAGKLALDPITTKFLGVLASNGRKGEIRSVVRLFKRLAAEHRGETTAEVTTARPLGDDQIAALKRQLRARAGRDVTIESQIDPKILGGIVVKLGSQMIDASIRTKLNRLAQAMKGEARMPAAPMKG
jgi:F-type H+-transporting ATPase subunit delta